MECDLVVVCCMCLCQLSYQTNKAVYYPKSLFLSFFLYMIFVYDTIL